MATNSKTEVSVDPLVERADSASLIIENTQVSRLTEDFRLYKNNPAAIQRTVWGIVDEVFNGKIQAVDPTNPLNLLIEASAVQVAAFMAENDTNNRMQYATAAQNQTDLYRHMSDLDYVNRFAVPCEARWVMMIAKKELLEAMVLDVVTGERKLTIPGNSEYTVDDMVFSLQYPVDIKQLKHGSLQVTYDVQELSPLQALPSNVVYWDIRRPTNAMNGDEMVYLELDLQQVKVESNRTDINVSSNFKKVYAFSNQFYYARVYYKATSTSNLWKEIKTTHSDQVYDPLDLTATLRLLETGLEVAIPLVYMRNGLISSGSIRVDIYQTKGYVNVITETYSEKLYSFKGVTIDRDKSTDASKAFSQISSFYVHTKRNINGGTDARSFEDLRKQVIDYSIGAQKIPITNAQIQKALEIKGFEIIKNVDVVTNRDFLATKRMPQPVNLNLITSASASIEAVIGSMDAFKNHPAVRDNGERITLVPEILYRMDNGIVTVLPKAEEDALKAKSPELIAADVNTNSYLYSPFHYVLDAKDNTFQVRPYFLDKPSALSLSFVSHNDTTDIQVNTGQFAIVKVPNGYTVLLTTLSSDEYKELDDSQLHCQLAFKGPTESEYAYLNGVIVGRLPDSNEVAFAFDIMSNYDIDEVERLFFTNFSMGAGPAAVLGATLKQDFMVMHSTSALMPPSWQARQEDMDLGRWLLPSRVAFITQESLTIEFGKSLTNLWAQARSLTQAAPYKAYDVDIPAVYADDVFKINADGSKFHLDASGNVVHDILHRKGDLVLAEDGSVILEHKKGDVMFDSYGVPIPVSPLIVVRMIDMMFIEGSYYFATDTVSAPYRDEITATLVDWITIDLNNVSKNLLEQSNIFFYPKSTMGNIQVVTQSGALKTIEAAQEFTVKLFVSNRVYGNMELRAALTSATVRVIDQCLQNSTVAMSNIVDGLKETYGSDVIGFDISNLGGAADLKLITVYNERQRLAIRKVLGVQPDGKLIVKEAVSVDFASHELQD